MYGLCIPNVRDGTGGGEQVDKDAQTHREDGKIGKGISKCKINIGSGFFDTKRCCEVKGQTKYCC